MHSAPRWVPEKVESCNKSGPWGAARLRPDSAPQPRFRPHLLGEISQRVLRHTQLRGTTTPLPDAFCPTLASKKGGVLE